MSFAFTVPLRGAAPAFEEIVRQAVLPIRVEVTAGRLGDPWPQGMIGKVADASTVPEGTSPGAGMPPAFLAYSPESSVRGVEVRRGAGEVTFRVCAFASPADYMIAARLAAGLAHATGGGVTPEHAPDGGPATPLAAAAVVAQFDDAFARRNAWEMSHRLGDEIAAGRTYWFEGPRGWARLGPDLLGPLSPEARFASAQHVIAAGGSRPVSMRPPPSTSHRAAQLLMAAAALALGDRRELTDLDRHQVAAQATLVPELQGLRPNDLIAELARGDLSSADLASAPDALRKKAFIVAAEIVASRLGGKLTGDLHTSPDLRALASLGQHLGIDTTMVGNVIVTFAAKHNAEGSDPTTVATLAAAIATGAFMARGRLGEEELRVMMALALSVPDFRAASPQALLAHAAGRLAQQGPAAFREDFDRLPKFRNKCFAFAIEALFALGRDRAAVGAALPQLAAWMRPSDDYAERTAMVNASKFATTSIGG